jgi:hypothetical protein
MTRAHRWLVVLVVVPVAAASQAADEDPAPTTHLSVASDVLPWALDGFSGLVALEPAALPRWRTTVELWRMRLPTFVVDRAGDNAGRGFRHRVRLGVALYQDRTLGRTGWHLGGVGNATWARVDRGGIEHGGLCAADLLLRAGYRWLPFGTPGPFLDPWLAVGLQLPLGDLPTVEGLPYALSRLQVLGTLHVGWRFMK